VDFEHWLKEIAAARPNDGVTLRPHVHNTRSKLKRSRRVRISENAAGRPLLIVRPPHIFVTGRPFSVNRSRRNH
jgi:hypothetical protein